MDNGFLHRALLFWIQAGKSHRLTDNAADLCGKTVLPPIFCIQRITMTRNRAGGFGLFEKAPGPSGVTGNDPLNPYST
jgi:hypothetical protein